MDQKLELLAKNIANLNLSYSELVAFLQTTDFPTLEQAHKNNSNTLHNGIDEANVILKKSYATQKLAINKLQSYFENYDGRPGIISGFAFDNDTSTSETHIAKWTAAPQADYYTIVVKSGGTVKVETGPIYDTSYGFTIHTTDGDGKLKKNTAYTFLITAHTEYGSGTTKSESKTTPDK